MSTKIVKKKVMNNLQPMEKESIKATLTPANKTPFVEKKPMEKPSGNGLELVDINANNKKRRNKQKKKVLLEKEIKLLLVLQVKLEVQIH